MISQCNLFDAPVAGTIIGADESISCALVTSDSIDALLGQFRQREAAIDEAVSFINKARETGVLAYFKMGYEMSSGGQGLNHNVCYLTNTEEAKSALRSEYWNRVLRQTNVFELMPASKRSDARKLFNSLDCPAFSEETVRPTIEDLLSQRAGFFAERVDGIFRALSKTHVTNQPSGFSKKMIIANVFDQFGYVNSSKSEILNDFRGVIGQITGRGEPVHYDTMKLLGRLDKGVKVEIDGGAFTITAYKTGTIHLTVSEEVAIELNSVLAMLYPLAIPSKFRTKTKTHAKAFDLKSKLLPFSVTCLLSNLEGHNGKYRCSSFGKSKEDIQLTVELLQSIGGEVRVSMDYLLAEFTYPALPVIHNIVRTGSVPEDVSYQFYPTRSELGIIAADMLGECEGLKCLEPNAGTGDLAALLPKENTTCIEISKTRCDVLEAKGFETICADFLQWADDNQGLSFDRILMNPPFSKGRALCHLQAASSLAAKNGVIVAILPASMINTTPLDGFDHEWSQVFTDCFQGTQVRVSVLTATKAS